MTAKTLAVLRSSFLNILHNRNGSQFRIRNAIVPHFSMKRRLKAERKMNLPQKSENFDNEVLFGRSVCNIAMKVSRRPIFRLHLLERWKHIEANDTRVMETIRLADERRIPIVYSNRPILDSMASHRPHQGVCLEVGELPFINFGESSCDKAILEEDICKKPPLWVLLYGILDPMNMGAILRSCFYFNVNRVLVSGSCTPMTPIVSKASSGAAEIIPIYSADNPAELIQVISKANWDIVGTVASSYISCNEQKIEDVTNFALLKLSLVIFGSEGFGIPDNLLNVCSRYVTIPACVNGDSSLGALVGSLNVSVATAIILHSLQQKRLTR